MRVLVTGSTGRLGSAFVRLGSRQEAGQEIEIIPLKRHDLDLTEPDRVGEILDSLEFDTLINPAAMSGLEDCLDHRETAHTVNVLSPAAMAEVCARKNARMVYFSTDYVFSGDEDKRYRESDTPSPINTYGKTKFAGEKAVLTAHPDAIVARVSWLFGRCPEGHTTHFDQIMQAAARGDSMTLIDDKFSIPTFTDDIVQWTFQLLQHHASGIYHLCNSGDPESWHSYADYVGQLAEMHHGTTPLDLHALHLADATFFREARPQHTAMVPARLIEEGIASPRHWKKAAEEYIKCH